MKIALKKTVTGPGLNVTYTYDPFGRRVKKEVNGVVTYFFYDGDQVIEERGSGGVLKATYTYGTGIDEVLTMNRNAQTLYYFYDGLGSVTDLTTGQGEIVESYTYDPYGIPNQTSAVGNPYFFTGRQLDPETGLYYYRRRYYDPKIGRFLQRDPVGYVDGLNLYTYVNNNPINLVDPYGLARWPVNKVVEKQVKERLKDIPNLPNLPGKDREQTVNEIAEEVGDKISDRDALDAKTGKNLDEILGRLLESLKKAHPDWPWQEYEERLGEMLGNKKKKK